MKTNLGIWAACLALGLVSCSGGEKTEASYTVAFDTKNLVSIPSQTVKAGEKAVEPTFSTPATYEFVGWYADSYYQVPFDFSWAITADWTIYARFVKEGTIASEPESSEIQSSESVEDSQDSGSIEVSSSEETVVSSEETTVSSSEIEETISEETPEATRIYLHGTTWWDDAGAILTAHYWGAESTAWPGNPMTAVEGMEDYFYVDVPVGTTGMVFARSNPVDGEVWNQTADAALEEGKNLCDISAGIQDAKGHFTGSWSTFGANL